jgi:hypothetical protein
VSFDKPYQLFVQQFCGWKELNPYSTLCSPAKGKWNVKLYNEAREHAKKLFGLRYRPKTHIRKNCK